MPPVAPETIATLSAESTIGGARWPRKARRQPGPPRPATLVRSSPPIPRISQRAVLKAEVVEHAMLEAELEAELEAAGEEATRR